MTPAEFFHQPTVTTHRQYEALRAFFCDKKSATEVATRFRYTITTVYSLVRDFKQRLQQPSEPLALDFFVNVALGRKNQPNHDEIHEVVVALRKKYLSVADIKAILDAQGKQVSERQIYNILRAQGFARLPRRTQDVKQQTQAQVPVSAPKTMLLSDALSSETFTTPTAGLLCFLPYYEI